MAQAWGEVWCCRTLTGQVKFLEESYWKLCPACQSGQAVDAFLLPQESWN